MGDTYDFSIELWKGAAFYVAIRPYSSAGESGYSNIEQFIIEHEQCSSIVGLHEINYFFEFYAGKLTIDFKADGDFSILGTGFIGLCSAACFAQKDIKVFASTHNEKKANQINNFVSPFFEDGLPEMLTDIGKQKADLLKCLTDPVQAVLESDITMITQGTPMRPDKSIDLGYIESTAKEIAYAESKDKPVGYLESCGAAEDEEKQALEKETDGEKENDN